MVVNNSVLDTNESCNLVATSLDRDLGIIDQYCGHGLDCRQGLVTVLGYMRIKRRQPQYIHP